ncbi:MAG: molybdopterin-dependent oxidoreductase [Nocardioides sp.]|nr:molybdopterin-dependent oxidoreductase [Nocardioides sp.]
MTFMQNPGPSRRTVLSTAVAGATAAVGVAVAETIPSLSAAALENATAAGPILKPLRSDRFVLLDTNAEMRWDSVRTGDRLTDQSHLFVRNHTSTPAIRRGDYRLRVFGDGLARRRGATRRSFTLDDLQRLPQTELTSVLECTGNGRSLFTTQQGASTSGTAWTLGAVGAVRWQGVLLRDLLERVGLAPDAVSIQATGLDEAYVADGTDHGHVRRPFGIRKALDDALLAWGANGQDLLPDHGYPLRLVLPGWVGIASIKWLGSLQVSRTELSSPWNTIFYRMTGGAYPADSPPLTLNPVRSAWQLPWRATLAAGARHVLHGRSWSGTAPVTRVEVSLDGGASWRPTTVRRAEHRDQHEDGQGSGPHDRSWTQWSVRWDEPTPGSYDLLARATDATGRTQPLVAAYNSAGYFFDAVVRHPVTVG